MNKLSGWWRLTIALLVPWFLYWGWRVFHAYQVVWGNERFRGMDLWYEPSVAERDRSLVIMLGVPLAVAVLILVTKWVREGFPRDSEPEK